LNSREILPLLFVLKVRLKDLKFELLSGKVEVESQINLQLSGKMSLKFNFNSSLLL